MAGIEEHEFRAPEETDRRMLLRRAQRNVSKADSRRFGQQARRVRPDWDVPLARRLPMRRSPRSSTAASRNARSRELREQIERSERAADSLQEVPREPQAPTRRQRPGLRPEARPNF